MSDTAAHTSGSALAAGIQPSPPKRSGRRWAIDALRSQAFTLVIVIGVLAVVIELDNSVFLTGPNIVTLLRSAVTTFIIGCAATVVFASGGLDLSVGAYFSLGGAAVGLLIMAGVPWPLAIVLSLAIGALLGLVNAALVILVKVPPIIATLATFYAVGGASVILTNGDSIAPLPDAFNQLGQGAILGVPYLILYAVAIGIIFHFVLSATHFGYNAKIIGGNETAALANGVRVRRVKSAVYALSGAVAVLAGVLYAARTGTGDPQAGGADLTFSVITAVLVGGTSLFGGVGSIIGTAAGAVLFAVIQNGLTIIGVNPLYSNVVIGVILAGAVALDSWRRSRAFRVGRAKR